RDVGPPAGQQAAAGVLAVLHGADRSRARRDGDAGAVEQNVGFGKWLFGGRIPPVCAGIPPALRPRPAADRAAPEGRGVARMARTADLLSALLLSGICPARCRAAGSVPLRVPRGPALRPRRRVDWRTLEPCVLAARVGDC